jgi:lysophospholipid acyltransferase (LPLAT)-like uncharacterized protein
MKLHPATRQLLGLAASWAYRALIATLDARVAYYDPQLDPLSPPKRPCLYLKWHEYFALLINQRPHCGVSVLMSQHGDADALGVFLRLSGHSMIRGSTQRGGATALRELITAGRREHIVITPDGPRGPRRTLTTGPVFLASKSGMPIVPLGVGYDRPWRLKSWDRFAIFKPFSRVRVIFGNEMFIPPGLDRDGLEHYRQRVEVEMQRITAEAEAWAESGARLPNEFPLLRGRLSRRFERLARTVSPAELSCAPEELETESASQALRQAA